MKFSTKTRLMRTVLLGVAFAVVLAACGQSGTTEATETTTSTGQTAATTQDDSSTATTAATTGDSTATENIASSNASDLEWDGTGVAIDLTGSSASSDDPSVTIADNTVTITSGGTYVVSGELDDGHLIVDSTDDEIVRIVLDGVTISSSDGPAIGVASAEEFVVILADGSVNTLTDASNYDASFEEANLDAALVSKADMVIGGSGTLIVNGNYNDAINTSDGLIIASGQIQIVAVDDGIRGKDYLVVEDGTITVTAGGDGLKSDNDEDEGRGYIVVQQGELVVEAGGDGIAAETDLTVVSGDITISTTGSGDVSSAKGLKAGANLVVQDGNFTIDSVDDGVHSNGTIWIQGGVFAIATGDDGMHADTSLTIDSGDITVSESYEGLESAVITINDGDITITSSDDGVNISGGTDGSGQETGPGGMGGRPGGGGGDQFADEDQWLYINGGTLVVYASGDGIDVNGYWDMTGGTVIIHGPTENNNGAIDVNGTFDISGGFLVAAGSAGMAESPDSTSEQAFLSVQFNGTMSEPIQIQDSDGNVLLTFVPAKNYQALAFSSPELVSGESYEFFVGATGSGSEIGGVYESSSDSGTSIGTATAN